MNSSSVKAGFNYALLALQAAVSKGNKLEVIAFIRLLGDMLGFYRKYWSMPSDWAYEKMINQLVDPADRMLVAALDADSRGLPEAAVCLAEGASEISDSPRYKIELASLYRKCGQVGKSRELCSALERVMPGDQALLSEMFMCDVSDNFWSGEYYSLLENVHRSFCPRVYMEIGVATGRSLALARAGTLALGVDPALADGSSRAYFSPENTPRLYAMTSDEFFDCHDVRQEMGAPCFDVAFIDGLHHFDQVLRDFICLERLAGPDSVVLIHDCLPVHPLVAMRERSTLFWTGDVWKIIPCLRTLRPDLEIVTLPLAPSGLALIRRLNPSSSLLARQYINIVEQFNSLLLPEGWNDRCDMLAAVRNESQFSLKSFIPSWGVS